MSRTVRLDPKQACRVDEMREDLDALALTGSTGVPEGTSSIPGSVQSARDCASRRQDPLVLGPDLNNPVFQRQLFALPPELQRAVLSTLRKLQQLTWQQVYRDAGIRWEAVLSRLGPHGGRLYTLRITRSCRAVAYREDNWLRLLSIHPDHDSAY